MVLAKQTAYVDAVMHQGGANFAKLCVPKDLVSGCNGEME